MKLIAVNRARNSVQKNFNENVGALDGDILRAGKEFCQCTTARDEIIRKNMRI
jgi:hypothetical protein